MSKLIVKKAIPHQFTVVHIFNPDIQEAEAGESLRTAWSTKQIPRQQGQFQRETLSPKTTKQQKANSQEPEKMAHWSRALGFSCRGPRIWCPELTWQLHCCEWSLIPVPGHLVSPSCLTRHTCNLHIIHTSKTLIHIK